jgi:hypothetical protein
VEIPNGNKEEVMNRIRVAALGLVLATTAASAQYSDWTPPVNLGPAVNSIYVESCSAISKNGLSLYFASNSQTGNPASGDWDLYVAQRTSLDEPWGVPRPVPNVNLLGSSESCPALSLDEHRLYFASTRAGGCGGADLYVSRRHDRRDDFGWEPPVNLGCETNGFVNTNANEFTPTFFEDEDGHVILYFSSNRIAGAGFDLFQSRMRDDDSFGLAKPVSELNTPFQEQGIAVRRDGLELIVGSNRTGTLGFGDLWQATRHSTREPWSAPVNLTILNTPSNEGGRLSMSFDSLTLYFTSNRPGGLGTSDMYVTTRTKLRGKQ